MPLWLTQCSLPRFSTNTSRTVTCIKSTNSSGLSNFSTRMCEIFQWLLARLRNSPVKTGYDEGGQRPPPAYKAFTELKQILCSEPLVAYPQPDRPFALIVDAAARDTKVNSKGERTFWQEGGLGAILCQHDHRGELHVVAYASWALSEHKKITLRFCSKC